MSPEENAAPVGVLVLDGAGRVTAATPRAEELLGGGGLEGTELAALVGDEDGPRLRDMLRSARGGEGLTGAFRGRAGRSLEVTVAEVPAGGEQGAMALVSEQAPDGRERAHTERELLEAKSLLDAVVQNTAEAVFVKDRSGRYLLLNEAGAAVLGVTPAQATGRLDSELMAPDTWEGVRAHDLQVMEGAIPSTREQEVETPEGKRTFLSAKAPYRGAGGEIIGVVGIARDITARKRAEDEQRLLADTSDLIESALNPRETVQRLADLTVAHFGELCVIDLLGDDGTISGVAAGAADPQAAADLLEVRSRWPIDPASSHPVARVLRSGRPEIVPEFPDTLLVDIAQSEEHLELMRRLRYRSVLCVPLRARGRTLGTVSVLHTGVDRTYDATDMRLVEGMAQRAAAAIDNAYLYEHQQNAAETLQRSLLPQALPQVAGIDLAVRYETGGPQVEVGGDWYDAVATDDGCLVFVIGDVAGRGIGAATIMGQLRNALRAYALDGEDPARALNRLDRFAELIGASVMATVIYGMLDPRDGRLRYASAGHPPPLVANGGTAFLGGATRGPLGIGLPAGEVEHEAVLDLSSTLLLYTDGLVERRGEDLAVGLERLKESSEGAPRDADGFCDHLVAALVGERAIDDTALLALRRVEG